MPEWRWDEDKYGPVEDVGVIFGLVERDGFKIGDRVRANDDYRSGIYEFFEGSEGVVAGFTEAISGRMGYTPAEVFVEWDDWDPAPVAPEYIEVTR